MDRPHPSSLPPGRSDSLRLLPKDADGDCALPKNVFFTTTIHLPSWPNGGINCDEAISKMHHFCHELNNVPITWIAGWAAMKKYKKILIEYCEQYGDDVGIMEYGAFPKSVTNGKEIEQQGWIEKYGLKRPDDFLNMGEEHFCATVNWEEFSYEEQLAYVTAVKKDFEAELGREIKLLASPFINENTVKAVANAGYTTLWGYNWNYACEGIEHKGCPPFCFYPSFENHNIPRRDKKQPSPLAMHWGIVSYAISLNADKMTRRLPAWCANAREMVDRSIGTDAYDFSVKIIEQYVAQAKNNPYTLIPIQLEADWMDEAKSTDKTIAYRTHMESHATEELYRQISTCIRLGATAITQTKFAEWHKVNLNDTPEMIQYREDELPELRGNGKDQAYMPVLVYADKDNQYWFSKSCGFSYVRKYNYKKAIKMPPDHREMPFEDMPKVYLKTRRSICIRSGIAITDEASYYEVDGLEFTSFQDIEDYAGVIWSVNVPDYVKQEDLEISGCASYIRLLREENLLFFKATMNEGDNSISIRCKKPDAYIKIIEKRRAGNRYEIWIENKGCEAQVCKIAARIDANLTVGGFWWNGHYFHNTEAFGFGGYNACSGGLVIKTVYPNSLTLHGGLNHISLELY